MLRRLSEKQVLKKLNIPDFRHLTKEKAIQLASMIPQMDPEVAKKALEQYPHLIDLLISLNKEHSFLIKKGLDDNTESVKMFHETINAELERLSKELEKDGISQEEREKIRERRLELVKLELEKDTENKNFIIKAWNFALAKVAIIGGVAVATLGVVIKVFGANDEECDDEELDSGEESDYDYIEE